MTPSVQINNVLQSLIPRDENEHSLLQRILDWVAEQRVWDRGTAPAELDLFLRQLPAEGRRHLHSLVEAHEIYHSIHGTPLGVSSPQWSATSLEELRQIRDFCLQDGLRGFF